MKKAFTMLELVFVIMIVGILSYFVSSSFQRNPLREAADQVVSHIRYTQHLAIMDDKFTPSLSLSTTSGYAASREVQFWYKGRWQLSFHNNTSGTQCSTTDTTHWSYSIFSDGPGKPNLNTGGYSGNPDDTEIAVNPLDVNKLLTGGYTTTTVACTDPKATKEMNLGFKYGIVDVDFLGGCAIAVNQQRIFFDYLGRPFYGGPQLLDNPYKNGTTNMLLTSTCQIELCLSSCITANTNEKITINIEPETGYTHIQ